MHPSYTPEFFTQQSGKILLLTFITFLLAMALTPVFTHYAFKHKLWKRSRTTAATGEKLKIISKFRIKRTIPRMAGIIAISAITATTVAFNLDRGQTWLPLVGLIGGGFVGLIDDLINIFGRKEGVAGLRPVVKFAMISLIALICGLFFYYKLGYTTVQFPVIGDINLGWGLIPLFVLVVVATSNAVNISDGVDGLAGGLLISAFGAFGVIAALQGNFGIAGFCLTAIGALLSYVWFNIPPARFVMGDVGSFAFGTSLGVIAMLTDTLFLLPLIAIVFVAEAGSSLIQILSKKYLGRKVFIAAPVHHHFEATGWSKEKVTMRFWIIGQVAAALGVVLALLGGYIYN